MELKIGDAVEFILPYSVQVCTAVMHYGFALSAEMVAGLKRYMDEKGFETLDQMRGRALQM